MVKINRILKIASIVVTIYLIIGFHTQTFAVSNKNPELLEACLYGDVNDDGSVDANDLAELINYIYNHVELSEIGKIQGDVTIDGKVDYTDYIFIQKHITNHIKLPVKNYLYGDVNNDGSIDANDLAELINYIYNHVELSEIGKIQGDVNLDGNVDYTDYICIQRYIVNHIPFPTSTRNTLMGYDVTDNSFTLRIKAQGNVKLTRVYWYYKKVTDSNYKKYGYTYLNAVKPITKECVMKGLEPKTTYMVYAIVYDTAGNKTKSETKVITTLQKQGTEKVELYIAKQVGLSNVTNVQPMVSGKKLTVKWDKVEDAEGYEVNFTSTVNGKKVTWKYDRKSTSISFVSFPKRDNYKVSVRAYKTVNGKMQYGEMSDEKVFNIK